MKTGVSFYKVLSESNFERISGTHFGSDSIFGIIKLVENRPEWKDIKLTMDDILQHGIQGKNNLDLTVADIYGEKKIQELGLNPDLIASSFGRIYSSNLF